MPEWLTTILIYLALQFVFVLTLQTFPNLIGSALTKKVEHKFGRRLEEAKTEMQSSYSTLKTSVDFISAGQAEYRSKTIAAVENLWDAVATTRNTFGDLIMVHSSLSADKIAQIVLGSEHGGIFHETIWRYATPEHITTKLSKTNRDKLTSARLFVGDKLWLYYSSIVDFHEGIAFSLCKSFGTNRYVDWRTDRLMRSDLEAVLSPETISEAEKQGKNMLTYLTGHLEDAFLKEARRVMSASEGLAEALSDLQSTLRIEHGKITEGRAGLTEKS